jgi:mannitol/fructose-specific phosphotransferase system IIA component (Ntr-type)
MNLVDYLCEDLVVMELRSRSRVPLFREMVGHLVERGYLRDGEEAINLLLEREKLMSTGIKQGFAIPHAYTRQLAKSLIAVGVSRLGIDFQSLDGEPVFFVFLLLGPARKKGVHVRLLARLSRVMSLEGFYEALAKAESPRDLVETIRSAENKVLRSPIP